MQLTNAQLLALKNAINAETDAIFVGLRNEGATGAMAEWLNEASTFVVWRTLVTEHEITRRTSPEGTTWSWPAFIARSEAERSGWARMFNGTYNIDPSLANVRQGLQDIFSGSANNAPAQRTHLLAICKRNATRGERVFATGTGTTAAPGNLVIEGTLSNEDVVRAISA